MNNETLQEKGYRLQKERDYKVDVDNYVLVHVDGRSFSKNIKNKFKKPFDKDLIRMMNETAIYLCENVQGAQIAYVQSDEISLLLKKNTPEGDIFFGGRLCKMQSIIASLATARFNQLLLENEIKSRSYNFRQFDTEDTIYNVNDCLDVIKHMRLVEFDCKVWDVDNANDAFAWFLFRNIDCVKNSKQQAAQTWLPHKELLNKTTDDQIAMLKEKKGIDWYGFGEGEKYGRIISKVISSQTKEINGEVIEYERNIWTATPGVDLTDEEKRNKFIEDNEIFKE